jgi:hypothetical protein
MSATRRIVFSAAIAGVERVAFRNADDGSTVLPWATRAAPAHSRENTSCR